MNTRTWIARIGWLVLIWAASVAALGVVVFAGWTSDMPSVFRHGLDANGDLASAEVDRNDAPGLGQGEERICHQVLRIACREVARKRSEQVELFAL